jgi:hypothetical protein
MYNFKNLQNKKHIMLFQKLLKNWFVLAVVTSFVACYTLSTNPSNAQNRMALIWEKNRTGNVTLKKGNTQQNVNPRQTQMQERQDVLVITRSWAKITLEPERKCYFQGNADSQQSLYNFPNQFGNKWVIASNNNYCKTIYLSSIQPKIKENKSSQNKQVTSYKDGIRIVFNDAENLIQTDEDTDASGRKLVVDVLLGSVTITSPQGQQSVRGIGQRYIYRLDSQTVEPVENITSTKPTDCENLNEFLEPNNNSWPQEITNQIISDQGRTKNEFCPQIPR